VLFRSADGIDIPVPTDTDTNECNAVAAATSKHIPPRFYPYVVETKTQGYTMIEYCCFEDSLLGNARFHKQLCRIVKITESIDARSHKAFELMRLVCKQDGKRVVLWSAIPCTGGCPWNFINGRTPEGQARIDDHVALMMQLLERFIQIAKIVKREGGIICFEWPGRCTYWKRRDVMNMIDMLQLKCVSFDGCALGLKSVIPGREHMFIKKPWKVYTNAQEILDIFTPYVCPGISDTHEHDERRGKNAKGSERYTEQFAQCVHKACRKIYGS
jgi:hypothetical protein